MKPKYYKLGEIPVKRFYLPDVKFTDICPECGAECKYNDGEYLSFPNGKEVMKVYCDCDAEFDSKYSVEIVAKLTKEE